MLFALLRDRLTAHLRERVRAGELTERSLARLTGLSQPHMHNVLKGVRSLSLEYADRILESLQISIWQLLSPLELTGKDGGTANVPHLTGYAGPAYHLERHVRPGANYPILYPFAEPLVDPVLITLAHDPLLFPYFQAGDIALVDRLPITLETLESDAFYLVEMQNGTLVRSVRAAGKRLYLFTPQTAGEPRKWEFLSFRGQRLTDVVMGKVVWLGRKLPI